MNKKQKKRECGSLGRYFAVFIIPALAIYLIFSILPFMYTIFYSFTDYTDMNPTNLHFVAFQNYIKVFQTPLMRIAIKNSLIYAILLTGFQVILGLPIAAVLNKKLKTRNLLRAVYFFPAVFSFFDYWIFMELYFIVLGLWIDQQSASPLRVRYD